MSQELSITDRFAYFAAGYIAFNQGPEFYDPLFAEIMHLGSVQAAMFIGGRCANENHLTDPGIEHLFGAGNLDVCRKRLRMMVDTEWFPRIIESRIMFYPRVKVEATPA